MTTQGQVFILDSLSNYTPLDGREAEGIIERVAPRLQHANSAVVMSAVRVILKYMDEITNQDTLRIFSKKLTPPLVTLLNSEPEIQYVALRNINLIVQKRPKILEHEIKVFFCKYNDPIYVKMEKLEIVIRLASVNNIDQVVTGQARLGRTAMCLLFIIVTSFLLISLLSLRPTPLPFYITHNISPLSTNLDPSLHSPNHRHSPCSPLRCCSS
jgi:Adaptin N terminal region